jgi:hypothetical protein
VLGDEVQTAYHAFTERVAAAIGDDAVGQRITDAYQQYVSLAGQAAPPTGAAFEAYHAYRALLRAELGTDAVRPRVSEAFSRFMGSVSAAWQSPSTGPGEIATAAEVVLSAAFIAHAASEPGAATPASNGTPASNRAQGADGAARPQPPRLDGWPGAATAATFEEPVVAEAAVWGSVTVFE